MKIILLSAILFAGHSYAKDPYYYYNEVADESVCPGKPITVEEFLNIPGVGGNGESFPARMFYRDRSRIGEFYGPWTPSVGAMSDKRFGLGISVANSRPVIELWGSDDYCLSDGNTLECENPFSAVMTCKITKARGGGDYCLSGYLQVVKAKMTSKCLWIKLENGDGTTEKFIFATLEK